MARAAGLPVIVTGDIDRGGVFAALYGTLALLDPADQALISGFVINKFRGAPELLASGIDQIQQLTGRKVLGVIPWREGLRVDAEDSLALNAAEHHGQFSDEDLKVAVLKLPRISNFTDVDPLAVEPGVQVRFVTSASQAKQADLLIIPGSRATVADLAWLRERGLDEVIEQRAKTGRPILGICAGYQMLSAEIDDTVESRRGTVPGLNLLPARVRFDSGKTLTRPGGGSYEIRHGVTEITDDNAIPFAGGCRVGAVFGTSRHGALEDNEFRREFLAEIAALTSNDFTPAADTDYERIRQDNLDILADLIAGHLDTGALTELIEHGAPPALPVVLASLHPAR
ncbi:MAG TPA: cobyric acid synthase [Streptosporangiaceae bacterium]